MLMHLALPNKILFVILLVAQSSVAWGAAFGRDAVSLGAYGGGDLIGGTLEARRHFSKPKDSYDFFVRGKRARDGEVETNAVTPEVNPSRGDPFAQEGPSPLSWYFRYDFARPTPLATASPTPAVSPVPTAQHFGAVGLEWEASPQFRAGVLFGVGTISDVDYVHGQVALRFDYLVSFGRMPGGEKAAPPPAPKRKTAAPPVPIGSDDGDARSFYRRRQNAAPAAFDPLKYPMLRFSGQLDLRRHQFGSGTSAIGVNQFGVGPDLDFLMDRQWSFQAGFRYWGYASNVRALLNGVQPSSGAFLILPGTGASNRAMAWPRNAQMLSFPEFIFEEGVRVAIDPRWSVAMMINQVTYALTGRAPIYGFAPRVDGLIDAKWGVSFGGAYYAAPAGASILGIAGVSYSL